ncbi:MAG: hypothetical protein RTU92_05745 [Candidatus Thorarchaeota archaeon]
MMQSEVQPATETQNETAPVSGVRRLFRILGFALIWGIIQAATLSSLIAAVWTVIPTDMLTWGADKSNLIGYVSHCSYTPVSTSILMVMFTVGMLITYKMKSRSEVGLRVSLGILLGIVVSSVREVSMLTLFVGLGLGVGIGILIAVIFGMARRVDV